MFIHTLDPVLFRFGFLEIRYYGLAYVLGLLLAYYLLRHYARQGAVRNLRESQVDDLFFYLILGLLLGARILFFLTQPSALVDAWEFFRIWHGGMAFHGALVGMVVAAAWYTKKHRLSFYALADILVIPAALGLFVGRIANFLNGELVGIKTVVPWCVQFPGIDGCRHPSQLYEAGKNLLIFFLLLGLRQKKRLREGTLFWTFIFSYGLLRLLITFLREDPRFYGLSLEQWLSLAMFILGTIMLYRLSKSLDVKNA